MGNSVGIEVSSVGSGPAAGLLSQAAYARHARVHPSTVNRWIQNGRISIRPDGLIDPTQADRERSASESPMPHHQARKAQIDAEKEEAARHGGQVLDDLAEAQSAEEIGRALKMETYRLQKAKAEQANLELDRSAGLLVERSEVEYLLEDLAMTLQSKLQGMAALLAPSLSAHRGDVSAIQSEIEGFARDLLTELAAHLERKTKEHLDE